MFIFADKSNSIYEMKPQHHEKLIMENITGMYQKASPKLEKVVGTFILSKLGNIIAKKSTGLYRDNGLVALRNMNAWGTDKMRKIVMKMFKEVGF